MEINYWLITSRKRPDEALIYSRQNGLQIRVQLLESGDYLPIAEGIRLYGQSQERLWIFDTSVDCPNQLLRMADAIRWYAAHIGNPSMLITAEENTHEQLKSVLN